MPKLLENLIGAFRVAKLVTAGGQMYYFMTRVTILLFHLRPRYAWGWLIGTDNLAKIVNKELFVDLSHVFGTKHTLGKTCRLFCNEFGANWVFFDPIIHIF